MLDQLGKGPQGWTPQWFQPAGGLNQSIWEWFGAHQVSKCNTLANISQSGNPYVPIHVIIIYPGYSWIFTFIGQRTSHWSMWGWFINVYTQYLWVILLPIAVSTRILPFVIFSTYWSTIVMSSEPTCDVTLHRYFDREESSQNYFISGINWRLLRVENHFVL